MKKLRKQALCLVVAFMLVVCMVISVAANRAFTPNGIYNVTVRGEFYYDWSHAGINWINEIRAEHGQEPIVLDRRLNDLAMQRAVEAAIYFSHDRPDGTTVFEWMFHTLPDGTNVFVSENLAAGSTLSTAINGWLSSPGHFDLLVSPVAKTAGFGSFWLPNGQMFFAYIPEGDSSGLFPPLNVVIESRTARIPATISVHSLGRHLNITNTPFEWNGNTFNTQPAQPNPPTTPPTNQLNRPARPATPNVIITNAAGNRARVTWNRVVNATSYRVYRRRGTGAWSRVTTTSALQANNIPVTRVAAGRIYDFRVVAVNSAGASTASPHRRISTLSSRRPAIRIATGNRRFTVRRTNNIPNVSRYEVRFRRVAPGRTAWTTRRIARVNSRVITGRRSGGRYQVQLRAVRVANGRTVNGAWSAVRTVRVR